MSTALRAASTVVSDPLGALSWSSLKTLNALPLSPDQQGYFAELFGPPAVQSIGHRLATHGEVRALAFLDLTPTVVRLYPAAPGAPE